MNGDGFAKPTPLPLDGGVTVAVPDEETFLYAKHGWANACPLQWHQNDEGYIVDRSIIDRGFWQAWKWWDGAWYWYLEKRPELFEDAECWGSRELIPLEPDSSSATVLGGTNRDFWEQGKFYID